MATEAFVSPPRVSPPIDNQPVVVPDPEILEEQAPGPWYMRLIPVFIGVIMISFFGMMIFTGTRVLSPMMMMAPMGMAVGALAYLGVGGAGGGSMGELNIKRKNYLLALREKRKLAHQHGRQIHALQSLVYPHPDLLFTRVGRPTMWTVRPETAAHDDDDDEPEATHPWLTARIGVGITRVFPRIKTRDQEPVDEQQEPFTYAAYRRFMRTQQFVTNCPLGMSLRELPAYAFRGDHEAVMGLARAVIVSLMYNSSPRDLTIGLICPNPDNDDWDWLKWAPHTQDRFRTDRSGTARLAWRSVSEFVNDARERPAEDTSHTVVFVDTPDSDVALPPGFSTTNTTFVILRAISESLTETAGRIRVTASRELSTPTRKNFAHADSVSVMQARLIAQKMSRHRPPNFDGVATTESSTPTELADFLQTLGINDLATFDPRPRWKQTALSPNFEIPIGFRATENYKRTNDPITLDFAEPSVGGTGLHGAFQGVTRSGKSYMLNGTVLALATFFPPEKLNLILMDFKGGSTFAGYEVLPHVVANITNLEQEIELVERAYEVIEGEIIRREQFLRKYKAKDVVAYRKMRREDPTLPPLPDLFIFVDEFREFMETHKEQGYLRLLTRVGAVGGGLGMHIIPCSQYIDQSLLQDLMEHLTFGISLKTQTGQRSRAVLKDTDAAKDLPMGIGAFILRRDTGERLTNGISFDVEAPYIPKRLGKVAAAAQNTDGATAARRLHRFTLSNQFVTDADEQPTPEADSGDEKVKYATMRDALIERLSHFDEVKALELWKPSLRSPISYADIDIQPATSQRLELRIGDTDAPRLHTRLPYVITPEGSKAHIRVIGRGSSGRTTAIEAIISAACRAYSPAFCSFYLVDYAGAKLGEMEQMPNVGGYARKSDSDKVARLIGEAFRLIDIREREFGVRGVVSLDQYFASRAANPVDDDPYGHFFLVIDGFPSFTDEKPEAKETFLRFLNDGGRLGVHLIVSGESQNRIPLKLNDFFGTTIQLAVEDPASSIGLDQRQKALLRAIPARQPGRCVDLDRSLAARIVIPMFEPVEPIGEEEGNPVYDPHADYSAATQRFVTAMQQLHTDAQGGAITAPRVDPAPPLIDYSVVWDVYDRHRVQTCQRKLGHAPTPNEFAEWWSGQRATDKHLPIGVSTEDLRIVTIPDMTSPHLVAVGEPKSGRTSLLRGIINSIVQQFTPEQAQIVILETKYELLTEQEELAKRGYLMGYSSDKTTSSEIVAKVKAEIERRNPTMDQQLTAAMIRDRSWYSGPEIFVLVDGVQAFGGSTSMYGQENPIDPIAGLVEGRNDLGLHVYITGPAQGFATTRMSSRIYKALSGAQSATLLFSGPVAEGTLWPGTGIKFAPRRPGQAMLVDAETMVPEVIQTAHARSWED